MSWVDLKDSTRHGQAYYGYVMGTRLDTGISGLAMARGMPADNHMRDPVLDSYAAVNLPVDRRDIGREKPWMDGGYHEQGYVQVSRDYAPFQANPVSWQAGNLASILRGNKTYPIIDLVEGGRGVYLPHAPKLVDPGRTGQGIVIPGSQQVPTGKVVLYQ